MQLVDDARGFDGPLAEKVRRRCRRVLDQTKHGAFKARALVREILKEKAQDGGETPAAV